MKIIFAGTPEFSVAALNALIQSEHTVIAVYTQPDRPAGRGRQLTASPVKQLAEAHQLPVYQPLTLRDVAEQQKLAALQADIMVVVAYGLILPKAVLQAPRLGCVNIHASLLPRWRGAAPIQRAILAGDQETGVTIMQMDEGLDTGPMLYKVNCPIKADDTSASLHQYLSKLGADALLTTLGNIANILPEQQDNSLATYANKMTKEEAELDWHTPAEELLRKIHAFNPWPIAYFKLNTTPVRIWQAAVMADSLGQPGEIIGVSKSGLDIATGKNILRLQKIQFPGGRVLSMADVLNSRQQDFVVGKILS